MGLQRRLIVALLMLSGCGALDDFALSSFEAQSETDLDGARGPAVTAAFNDTYLERIDLNEPKARANPFNTDKDLFRLIRRAKHHLDGAFYDIEELTVVDELIRAHERGVRVRLVTDSDNLVDKTDPGKPREAIERLRAAGIPVVDDQRSAIMHHKFLVIDHHTVWSGSTNLTPTSLWRHNNNALTIRSTPIATAFSAEFERLFERHEFGSSTRLFATPVFTTDTADGQVQAFFSPRGGGREAVVRELGRARRSIKFMTFSLTDQGIGDVMRFKAQAGVSVTGVFDRWLAAGAASLYPVFRQAKMKVFLDGNEALMHHKVIVIDQSTVITGSYNYSENAEVNNNEAFFIFRGNRALATAYGEEFGRLLYAATHNHPPAVKRPDAEHKTGEGP